VGAGLMAERILPQTGWVQPTEIAYCDVCGRRVWTWEPMIP